MDKIKVQQMPSSASTEHTMKDHNHQQTEEVMTIDWFDVENNEYFQLDQVNDLNEKEIHSLAEQISTQMDLSGLDKSPNDSTRPETPESWENQSMETTDSNHGLKSIV